MRAGISGAVSVVAVVLVLGLPTAAQEGAPGTVAERIAKARAAAVPGPIPRLPDGKPDFQGRWNPNGGGTTYILEEHEGGFGVISAGPSLVVDPPDGLIPYQPWALAERDRRRRPENAFEDNRGKCYLTGTPRPMWFGFQVYQPAGYFIRSGNGDRSHSVVTRMVDGNSRTHLPDGIRLWMGDSIGYWDGDTLVIESKNFNGKFWLALGGIFFGEDAHMVERFWMVNKDTMWWEATITDPKVFTRPWTMKWPAPHTRRGNPEIPLENSEDSCHEGNLGLKHMKNNYDAVHGVDAWEKTLTKRALIKK